MAGNAMFNVQINKRLKEFGGVIIAFADLFQHQPVKDGYIFEDIDNSEYSILAPNLWQKHFKILNSMKL